MGEIGRTEFRGTCYLVYCNEQLKVVKKSVACSQTTTEPKKTTPTPTTPGVTTPEGTTPTTPEVTTPEGTTPTTTEVTTPQVTTPTAERCIYKEFVYEPGQMIGIVMMQEN